jgi:hypothetical protein
LKHKYEDLKQSSRSELQTLADSTEADLAAKDKEIEKLKYDTALSPSKSSVETLRVEKKKLEDKVGNANLTLKGVGRGPKFFAQEFRQSDAYQKK